MQHLKELLAEEGWAPSPLGLCRCLAAPGFGLEAWAVAPAPRGGVFLGDWRDPLVSLQAQPGSWFPAWLGWGVFPPPGGLGAELAPLTHFEEGLELQGPDGWLLFQVPVGLGDALHLHLGAPEELVGPIPVLDEAARDLQRQLPASTGARR